MRYLLDTCVFSELSKPMPDFRVTRFLDIANSEGLWMSVLSIGELVRGVEILPQGKRRMQLEQWVVNTQDEFEDRLASVDAETSRIWGELTGRLRRQGVQLAIIDGLIAATALQHGMHVVTRNVKDFEPTGVLIVNPWETE